MTRLLLPILGTLALVSVGLAAQAPASLSEQAAPTRFEQDLRAMEQFRPGYTFWRHIFTIPDGAIAFGSATDGRLLAVFPARADWTEQALWIDPAVADVLANRLLPAKLDDRRDHVAEALEERFGPIVHNPTRGLFVAPNARRYGGFVEEWSRIYARFGVPADLGLAQALVESGLDGTRRSEARALGFCQFLESNLKRLNRIAPHVIEGRNQTAQAPYCAAYLSVLATKYGSYIPALSDHHSGGVNVGRTLINGERLGADDVRERYFLGSQLARDLRLIDLYGYRDLYRTYGPRSYHYAEMVFGNMANVREIMASTRQEKIYGMRVARTMKLADITRRTGLSADEVRRFNPALVRQVPARATLYLPKYVKEFGPDVSFWHRPASAAYAAVLDDFVGLEPGAERWDDAAFAPVLREFQQRFRATKTEEGTIMATVLEFVLQDENTRGAILAEFRASSDVRSLFDRAVRERDTLLAPSGLACSPASDIRLASGRSPC